MATNVTKAVKAPVEMLDRVRWACFTLRQDLEAELDKHGNRVRLPAGSRIEVPARHQGEAVETDEVGLERWIEPHVVLLDAERQPIGESFLR